MLYRDYSSLEQYRCVLFFIFANYNVNVSEQKFAERYSVPKRGRSTENSHCLCLERSFRLAIDKTLLNLHIDETTCQGRSEGSMTLPNNRSMFDNIYVISRIIKGKRKRRLALLYLHSPLRFFHPRLRELLIFMLLFPLFGSHFLQGQRSVDLVRQTCIIYTTTRSNAERRK